MELEVTEAGQLKTLASTETFVVVVPAGWHILPHYTLVKRLGVPVTSELPSLAESFCCWSRLPFLKSGSGLQDPFSLLS